MSGEEINYKVVVTNTGNETLTNVVVGDTTLGTTLGTLPSLAVGASATYTASQTVTQADLNQILGGVERLRGFGYAYGPGFGPWFRLHRVVQLDLQSQVLRGRRDLHLQGHHLHHQRPGHRRLADHREMPRRDHHLLQFVHARRPRCSTRSTNCWVTTLPANCNPGSVFLSGLPVTVPSGCNFNNSNITWSIGQSTNNCGASNVSWDASCGGFNNFNQGGCNGQSNYNQIGVQSCDNIGGISSGWGWYSTTTCAGTPQNQYNSYNCNSVRTPRVTVC